MSFTRRLIKGTGPVPCDVMLVGEAGGYDEHRKGHPFVGRAGMVLSTYCKVVGIDRAKVYIDNTYPYWPGPGNPDPTEDQIREGGERLRETIKRVRPRFVGALGRIAARWFLGDGVEMKRDHGLGFHCRVRGVEMVVVPIYHPAAGFYDPSAAALCQGDLGELAALARGEKEPWEEREIPRATLVGYPTPRATGIVPRTGDSLDTEGTVGLPQMMSWAASYGAFVARYRKKVDGPPLLPERLTFHYALHDLKVLRAMGADTDHLQYDDTLVMAFDLTGGGQDSSGEDRGTPLGLSLKNLAYRELQVRMQDFKDLVRPYYNKRVGEWVDELLDKDLPEKSEQELKEEKGKWKIYTPNPPRRRLGAVLLDSMTGGTPEKRWKDLPESMRTMAEEKMGEGFPSISTSIVLVPEEKAVQYSGADAWATRELAERYRGRLRERGLERVYEVDRRALGFYDEMMRNGLPIDLEMTRGMQAELEEKAKGLIGGMRGIVGKRAFNPGSRDDVADFLFRVNGLEAPRKTEGDQDSTDEKTVKILRARMGKADGDLVTFLDKLLEYREAQKYLGTYIGYMLEGARELSDGWRLYPDDLSATRVVSGRLSGRLLTFPTRTELGARIRKCFRAWKGKSILSVDLSQIELRVMAEMSQDRVMLGAFERGEDLHALTGKKMFRVKEVSKIQRYIAKTLNFAILYGISARALLEQLAVAGIYEYTLADCERFIEEWFRLYSGVREYLERLWKDSEKTGEVRDWLGRVRYVPNIRLPEGPLKEKARRDIGNFPIQAGARELVKIAEGEMVPWLRGNRGVVAAILDIHDETLFEVDEDVVEEAGEIVKGFMLREGRERFGVELDAGVSWGGSWGEAK